MKKLKLSIFLFLILINSHSLYVVCNDLTKTTLRQIPLQKIEELIGNKPIFLKDSNLYYFNIYQIDYLNPSRYLQISEQTKLDSLIINDLPDINKDIPGLDTILNYIKKR